MRVDLTEHIEKHWTVLVYSGVVTSSVFLWLNECLEGSYCLWGMEGFPKIELYFEYPSDAMLFKLAYQ